MSKVAVVILNWNTKEILEKYLVSVCKYSRSDEVEIVVADNGSSDDSVDFVEQNYPDVRVICLKENHGFAGGYNRALKSIQAEYYVLLNSDVEVTENWLDPMMKRLENDGKIAACMPKIKACLEKDKFEYAGAAGGFIDKYGYPFCRGRIMDSVERDCGQYDEASEIFWASGACLFIRSELFWEVDGFDEDFFAHMEEIDLCWRLKNLGHQIWYEPDSTVYHLGGGTLPYDNPKKLFLNFRNNLWLLYKNLPDEAFQSILFKRKVLDGIAGFKLLSEGNIKGLLTVFKAHGAYYRELKQLKRKRSKVSKVNRNNLGHYSRSVVFEYFIRKKRRFSDLNWR